MEMMWKKSTAAINTAKKDPRPSIIICHTTIGFGLPTKQGTEKAHGEPPGEEELTKAKENAGWPTEEKFFISADVLEHFRKIKSEGAIKEKQWQDAFNDYKKACILN